MCFVSFMSLTSSMSSESSTVAALYVSRLAHVMFAAYRVPLQRIPNPQPTELPTETFMSKAHRAPSFLSSNSVTYNIMFPSTRHQRRRYAALVLRRVWHANDTLSSSFTHLLRQTVPGKSVEVRRAFPAQLRHV